jgi:ADP-ribose pyrophosphatase YjhB (NUDIX family)
MPAPGVGCGAWIEEDGRVLLVHRLRPPEQGLWNLPGGKVDWGERTADAVLREIAEELGVRVEVTGLLCVAETFEPGHHWVAPVYRARIVEGVAENREPAKHAEIRWWPVESFPEALAAGARAGLAAVLQQVATRSTSNRK